MEKLIITAAISSFPEFLNSEFLEVISVINLFSLFPKIFNILYPKSIVSLFVFGLVIINFFISYLLYFSSSILIKLLNIFIIFGV